MVTPIISKLTICSKSVFRLTMQKTPASHHWPFMREIPWSMVYSPHKGSVMFYCFHIMTSSPGVILYMRPANERQRYNVTSFLIGWAHIPHIPASYIQQVSWCVYCESVLRPSTTLSFKQSGTKPNLVAKIWPPNLVTNCAWLPKLVDNISC